VGDEYEGERIKGYTNIGGVFEKVGIKKGEKK
jgi:hypothetical protein